MLIATVVLCLSLLLSLIQKRLDSDFVHVTYQTPLITYRRFPMMKTFNIDPGWK